ncbi:MAG: DNA primase [Crocinitomicaceae bacterium]
MGKIPTHIIDTILQTARIEEVIGEYVNLKRAGSNLKGLSPFTDEKTPSFVVSPAKQIFKCFSTGKGGTVVTFLMEKEHYSYPEALKWLAGKYNIEIPEEKPATPEELAAISERESLHIINEFAKDFFSNNLHESEEGKAIGLSYFQERGFRNDIIKKFQLGYCLNKSDDFTKAALNKNYKLEYLEKVGLVKSKDERYFDFFRGRVMFPIHSITGRTLGFGGRTLFTDKKIAKYFNSPESIIYNKSEILYGLYFAKGEIIKYDNCYLCEGYTDVISMHQAGIENVVSSSGTSLTKEQIKLIKRYTDNITILYDGDAAGIKASFRGIDLILQEGMNVNVILFPEGEDPDSYSKKVSSNELNLFLDENKQNFVSFKSDILLKDHDNDPLQKANLIKEIVNSIALIPDQIARTLYSKDIASRFEVDESIILSELNKIRKSEILKGNRYQNTNVEEIPVHNIQRPTVEQKNTSEFEQKNDETNKEFELIRKLVKYGAFAVETEHLDEDGKKCKIETSVAELICHELDKDELIFITPLYNKIHQIILEGLSEKTLYKSSFFQRHEDQDIVKFVSDIETEKNELSPQWISKHNIDTDTEFDRLPNAILSAIYDFKLSKIKAEIAIIETKLAITESEDEITDLILDKMNLDQIAKIFSELLGRITR